MLIDIVDTSPNLLTLISANLAPIVVPSPVLREVMTLDEQDCPAFGITVIEPTVDQLLEAGTSRGALSEEDWLCLIVARDSDAICVTNDGALHRACGDRAVPCCRGLRLLIALVECGALRLDLPSHTLGRCASRTCT